MRLTYLAASFRDNSFARLGCRGIFGCSAIRSSVVFQVSGEGWGKRSLPLCTPNLNGKGSPRQQSLKRLSEAYRENSTHGVSVNGSKMGSSNACNHRSHNHVSQPFDQANALI